ncbi:hypothetical protein AGMMS49546_16150 [Spirochaetia bacterium]|nr:hypothetical protein AGMMS49546_16150 [Spirochaetia bacterium]
MIMQTEVIRHAKNNHKKRSFLPRILAVVIFNAAFLSLGACSNPIINGVRINEPGNSPQWYEEGGSDYSPEEWQECVAVLEQLSLMGITKPERFNSLQEAKYITEQRFYLANRTIDSAKPLTVAMYPRFDNSGAFLGKRNSLAGIITHQRQQLLYFEITGDAAFKSALRLLKDNLPAGKELVLIIAGHGNDEFLLWDNGTIDYFLDPTDYADTELTGLLHSLNISLVFFESCQAGFGGSAGQNQANRFAEHIRAGGKVIAPTIDVYKETYTFGADDRIQDIIYNKGEPGITYKADGRLAS